MSAEVMSKLSQMLLSSLWAGDISSIGTVVRASYDVLKSFDTSPLDADGVRAALRDFQKALVRDAVPTVDAADGLPKAFEKVEELRELTGNVLDEDLPIDESLRIAWRMKAKSLQALYEQEHRYAIDHLRQLLKTLAATAVFIACGSWISTKDLNWPVALLIWLLVGICCFVTALRYRRATTRHRKVIRHRRRLLALVIVLIAISIHPLLVIRASRHVWLGEPWPKSKSSVGAEALFLEVSSVAPGIEVRFGDKGELSKLESRGTSTTLSVEHDRADSSGAAIVEYIPEATEQLLPMKFDILDEIDVDTFLRNPIAASAKVRQAAFSQSFDPTDEFWNELYGRDRDRSHGRLGIVIRNTSNSELGPGKVYLFTPETRRTLGLVSPISLELPRIPPRQAVFAYLSADPQASDSWDGNLNRDELRLLVEAQTTVGQVSDVAIPDTGLRAVPSTVKVLANARLSELLTRRRWRFDPWTILVAPFMSAAPEILNPTRNASTRGWDAEVQIRTIDNAGIRSQVRSTFAPSRMHAGRYVQEMRIKFSTAFPLKSRGVLNLMTVDGRQLASIRTAVTGL